MRTQSEGGLYLLDMQPDETDRYSTGSDQRALSHKAMVTSLDGTPQQIKNRGTEWLNMALKDIVEIYMRNMK